jgi:hypothetical protein
LKRVGAREGIDARNESMEEREEDEEEDEEEEDDDDDARWAPAPRRARSW